MNEFKNLLSPMKIGKMTVKNRICMSPMDTPGHYDGQGKFSQEGIEYFAQRAKGGFGLIFLGAAQGDTLDPGGILNQPLSSADDYFRTGHWLTDRCHFYGAKVIAQSSLGLGRAFPGTYAPSKVEVAFEKGIFTHELSVDQIHEKVDAAVKLAALQKASGFDGVEVHALHWGYLLDQFAMSLTNHREDEYGGSLENRMRITKEVISGIKQECGADFPVTIRFSLKSFMKTFNKASLTGEEEVGRTIEESIKIAQLLEEYGIDALNTSMGYPESYYYRVAPMYMKKGYGLEYVKQVKAAVNIPVIAAGRMDDPYMAEKAIASGYLDAIALGRPSIADPYFPSKLMRGRPEKIRPCLACNMGCVNRCFGGEDFTCSVNPGAGRELTYTIHKSTFTKKVAVIGGGIAGMEAARTAKLRGHDVTIYEQSDKLGGNAIAAGMHSFKKDIHRLIDWYKLELDELGIPIQYNCKVDLETIKTLNPDTVIIATGSKPIVPNISGVDKSNVSIATDVLLGKSEVKNNIVIVGGGLTGVEMAVAYAQEGKKITLVEALDKILSTGPVVPDPNKMMLYDLLEEYNIPVLTGKRLEEINEKGALIKDALTGNVEQIECEQVILAMGMRSENRLVQELKGYNYEIYCIGDAMQVANILAATGTAYEVAREL